MTLYEARRTWLFSSGSTGDRLYDDQPDELYVIGTRSKPTRLADDPDYLIYVLLAFRGGLWRGDQIALSATASVETISRVLGRYWRPYNERIDQYDRFYDWQVMTLQELVAFNKQQHALPISQKPLGHYWNNLRGLSLA